MSYSKNFSPVNHLPYLKTFTPTDFSSSSAYDLSEILKLSKTNTLGAVKVILSIPPKERTPMLINIVTSYTAELTFFKKLIEEQPEEAHIACCQQMTCEVFKRKEFELFRVSMPDVDKQVGRLFITLLSFFKYNFWTVDHGYL